MAMEGNQYAYSYCRGLCDCEGSNDCPGTDRIAYGDGDCDTDSDCAYDLVCGTDNCGDFRDSSGWPEDDPDGWDTTDDCCMQAHSHNPHEHHPHHPHTPPPQPPLATQSTPEERVTERVQKDSASVG